MGALTFREAAGIDVLDAAAGGRSLPGALRCNGGQNPCRGLFRRLTLVAGVWLHVARALIAFVLDGRGLLEALLTGRAAGDAGTA
jgi:hypothetical protein